MIDFFMRWASEADAKQDALMLADYLGREITPGVRSWLRDRVLPGIKAWRPSQDIITGDGTRDNPFIVTHQYLSGWFAIVSLTTQPAILLNASALAFALNRDGPPYIVKNNIGAIISDVAVEPIFLGSHYPMGGYV